MQASSLVNIPLNMWEDLLQDKSKFIYNINKVKHVDCFQLYVHWVKIDTLSFTTYNSMITTYHQMHLSKIKIDNIRSHYLEW